MDMRMTRHQRKLRSSINPLSTGERSYRARHGRSRSISVSPRRCSSLPPLADQHRFTVVITFLIIGLVLFILYEVFHTKIIDALMPTFTKLKEQVPSQSIQTPN